MFDFISSLFTNSDRSLALEVIKENKTIWHHRDKRPNDPISQIIKNYNVTRWLKIESDQNNNLKITLTPDLKDFDHENVIDLFRKGIKLQWEINKDDVKKINEILIQLQAHFASNLEDCTSYCVLKGNNLQVLNEIILKLSEGLERGEHQRFIYYMYEAVCGGLEKTIQDKVTREWFIDSLIRQINSFYKNNEHQGQKRRFHEC